MHIDFSFDVQHHHSAHFSPTNSLHYSTSFWGNRGNNRLLKTSSISNHGIVHTGLNDQHARLNREFFVQSERRSLRRWYATLKDQVNSEHKSDSRDNQHSDGHSNKEDPSAKQDRSRMWRNLRKLLQLSKGETNLFIIGFLALIITSASSMYLPIAIGGLVDVIVGKGTSNETGSSQHTDFVSRFKNLLSSGESHSAQNEAAPSLVDNDTPSDSASPKVPSQENLKRETLKLMAIFAVGTIAIAFRISTIQVIGLRIQARLRKELFYKIVKRDMEFFDKRSSGELINRLGTDVTLMSDLLTRSVVSGVKSTVEALISIGLLCYISASLTLTAMSLIPPTAIVAVLYGRYIRKLYKDYTDALARANAHASEKFSNIRTVKAFVTEDTELRNYGSKVDNSYLHGMKAAVASGVFHSEEQRGIALITVLYGGGQMTLNGLMSVGDLTSFMLYSIYAGSSFSSLSSVYGDISRALGSSERVFALLDEQSRNETAEGLTPDRMIGDIEFKLVSFCYPTRPESLILDEFSVKIPAGSFTALVSESGQGKSTITHLLSRLYVPQSGEICIDGINVKDLNVQWLRDHISIVPQEPILFEGTLRENIMYGNSQASEEELHEAMSLAQCDFIWSFPKGLDTEISERGASLSGGQRQRVAIARALLKSQSRILILDEYSSNLDSHSESALAEVLKNIVKNRTVILITHRLSSIRSADQILVLDEGKLIQHGNHQALLQETEGKYAALVEKQLK
eukprot:CAMPEP_0117455972 /NCGR_PEP_ID=MMETSP0759-20121206/11637_1 /TAXON_ID=63605 /ORGANISM="Percolomonas cosmopolitus, Strain WS" /LENGTH=741 /DNA_ID=CAMNT_0005249297 /DNA_START=30 /DNA_END=2254 /DNA_ORIENTATION=+